LTSANDAATVKIGFVQNAQRPIEGDSRYVMSTSHSSRSTSRREFLKHGVVGGVALATAGMPAPSVHAVPRSDEPKPAAKSPWRIGCYTRPWDKHDYRVALDGIADAGFRYVGLMTTRSKTRLVISTATTPEEAQKVGDEARKRGLKIASVYGGGIPVAKSLEDGIAGLRRLIDNSAAARAESLLMGGIGDAKLYDRYYAAIRECAGYAREKKVAIVVKPHGGTNATGPQCRKAVELVKHANFRLWYDPGNIYYYSDGKLDPVADAATVDGIVTGMCIKDYRHPKNVLVTPGDGQVDFPRVLARLRRGGFKGGPLVIETLAPGDLKKLAVEARKARGLVESLVAASEERRSTR